MSKGRYSPFGKFAIGVGVVYLITRVVLPLVLVVGVFAFLARSCHDEEFLTEEEIVEKMQEILPNARLIRHEVEPINSNNTPDTLTDDNIKHVYYFDNMGINFTLEEMKIYVFGSGSHINHTDNYAKSLGEFFTAETLCGYSDKLDSEKLESKAALNLTYYYNVDSCEEIPEAVENFEIIYDIVYDYLPVKDGGSILGFSPELRFGVNAPAGENKYYYYEKEDKLVYYVEAWTVRASNEYINWEDVRGLLFDSYKESVSDGYIKDPILTPDTAGKSSEISEYEII